MSENFNELTLESASPKRPGYHRRKKLESEYKSLTKEEEAELMGLRVFPDNQRGAELRKKEALGLIDDKEKEELRRLYQLKTRREQMSPAVQQLWERTEASDPNIERVYMDDGKSLEVLRNDEREKTIWTSSLGGCYGTAVFTEHEDGTRNCVLTHYSILEVSANMTKLRDLISSSEKMKTAKFKNAVLVMPGEWAQDPETKKYAMKAKNQRAIDALSTAIKVELGREVEIKIEPYSKMIDMGEKDWGIFAVYIPPSGKGDARYQTWFSGGKLTE